MKISKLWRKVLLIWPCVCFGQKKVVWKKIQSSHEGFLTVMSSLPGVWPLLRYCLFIFFRRSWYRMKEEVTVRGLKKILSSSRNNFYISGLSFFLAYKYAIKHVSLCLPKWNQFLCNLQICTCWEKVKRAGGAVRVVCICVHILSPELEPGK